MTETSPDLSHQNITTSRYDSHDAKSAIYDRLRAETMPRNKAAIFDAFENAGISQAAVTFDGYGDSGQIEDIQINQDPAARLPAIDVEYEDPKWGETVPVKTFVPLRTAIENIAYQFLGHTHGGWENNDGAFGTFIFDTATRKITLEYNERITDTDYSEHEF